MTLTQEQIIKMSEKLWKVTLNDPKLAEDLNNILKYVDLLNEIDTTWVESTVSVINEWSPLRKDLEEKKEVSPKDLLNCSNQKVVASQIAISNIMN